MIGSFRHRGLKRLYKRGDRSRIPAEYAEKLENILFALDTALVGDALDLPGFRLHPLRGGPERVLVDHRSGQLARDLPLSGRTGPRYRFGRLSLVAKRVFTMAMLNPPHPGHLVRQECIEALGLTVTETAKVLGVTRQALNNLVNETAGISPEMAIRLEQAFGSTADTWLRMQAAYDLAQARKKNIHLQRFVPA
jgi:addiction module HigA family antidote